MVRLHIRGADANYRRLRHLSALVCVVIVFLHHKAPFHPSDKKEGWDCVMMSAVLRLEVLFLSY